MIFGQRLPELRVIGKISGQFFQNGLSLLKDLLGSPTMTADQQRHAQILTTIGQLVTKSRLGGKICHGLFQLLLFRMKNLLSFFRVTIIPK